ncbi:LlsX family protein [Actinomyces naeslundii]|jgi:hypothetical protein|uniref:LlsX family protein n=1 Tax=Actinomyces naeslundii TaxID=1655 RepID=A0AA47FI60_ACTNA|nr:LlsX family protein [Actinomyces naeslundii]OMG16138.1 hypothetical protein BKH04_09455 [Actinomyces naeslundii]PKY94167.1 hypothetical protein CYJ18_12760 [Actinomyces naeslundii]WAL42846.1 LlsX family protein [Actinomyces naeslundii]
MKNTRNGLMSQQVNRLSIAIIAGIIMGVALCAVMISFGYRHAYSALPASYDVRLLGLPIYHLTRVGETYTGVPVPRNMVFVGILCSLVLAVLVEAWWHRKKNRHGDR